MLHLIDEESVHCVVTSPPYFNLRDYKTGEWHGGDPACSHEHSWVNYPGTTGAAPRNIAANRAKSIRRNGGICPCGARFDDGQIGHEATPAEYVARLVQVARAVRRVLRPDGTFWLNLGDSYASNPKGPGGQDKSTLSNSGAYERIASAVRPKPPGIAVKQLLGIPWRVAFALQDDGWYLRQAIVWRKTNPMPESVRDRCTRSYEQIFMFSKGPRYFYDADAIAEPAVSKSPHRWVDGMADKQRGHSRKHAGFNGRYAERIRRDGPPKTRNKRDVWTVATRPFKGAHFATFPPDLIEPCILAGCPEGGTVLDPFGGSGTTALVALRNNRNAVLCELNPGYVEMAHARIAGGK
jgi:site-specific DNA-methyltransferase (adenine-specific)